MSKAFVYTELQASVPFTAYNWRDANAALITQPGLVNKTWLSGLETNSAGGLYEFESLASAKAFAIDVFPSRAAARGVAQTTRIFDGAIVEEASRGLNSVHFGGKLTKKPGAFVYTEVQINVPFRDAPWRDMNPVLASQPGFLAKTWLAGVHTNSLGGIYGFDTIENARRFATQYFPTEAKKFDVAYTTRIFDAAVVEDASRAMRSPFFAA